MFRVFMAFALVIFLSLILGCNLQSESGVDLANSSSSTSSPSSVSPDIEASLRAQADELGVTIEVEAFIGRLIDGYSEDELLRGRMSARPTGHPTALIPTFCLESGGCFGP